MFTLRKITPDGIEMNFNLGESYTVVDSQRSPEEFKRTLDSQEYFQLEKEKIYSFVCGEQGYDLYPLFLNQRNYIVGAKGKTFDNLTKR